MSHIMSICVHELFETKHQDDESSDVAATDNEEHEAADGSIPAAPVQEKEDMELPVALEIALDEETLQEAIGKIVEVCRLVALLQSPPTDVFLCAQKTYGWSVVRLHEHLAMLRRMVYEHRGNPDKTELIAAMAK